MTMDYDQALTLEQLNNLPVDHGGHPSRAAGRCTMELVSWFAGLPHTEAPACTHPWLAQKAIEMNDTIRDDNLRTRLMRPLVPVLAGTAGAREGTYTERVNVIADWALRGVATAIARAAGADRAVEAICEIEPFNGTNGHDVLRAIRTAMAGLIAPGRTFEAYIDAIAFARGGTETMFMSRGGFASAAWSAAISGALGVLLPLRIAVLESAAEAMRRACLIGRDGQTCAVSP